MRIETKDIFFFYKSAEILKGISFKADSGELIAILGPNGAGKTTFIRCLLGFLKTKSGSVTVNQKPIESYSRKELANEIAYIPQSYSPAFNHKVIDSVMMGMSSKIGLLETPGKNEEEKAKKALKELGILQLADRGSMKISGGEKQLMLLARALVQDAHILIMDEPTSNLDFGNSYKVMKKVKELSEKGYTIIFSTHDPNMALRFATRVIGIKDGKIIADGKPSILSEEVLSELYGIDAKICSQCNGVIVK